ncbi:MAG: S46 family peptidase, partial [Bacteroidetes bacterium]|nr:S46 family peptidase [Bacteroidota bacterium]
MKFSSWIRGLAAGLMFVFVLPVSGNNPPDEGMWLPMLLERLNYVDMQKMGLRLTPEELYSINHSSLKDAIVGLSAGGAGGFFCTGEVVSDQGLVFTNHHCGYDAVATLSTPEHDYLTNGFWAMEKSQELSCEGMVMAFLVRVENVTDSIIPFLSDTLDEGERSDEVKALGNKLKKKATEGTKYEAVVKSFYGGNEFYLFVYNVYKDIRLVGAPPSSVGKFGGDTDNWMWPRHTGDFSIFRIYADSAGNPAEYAENNVPLVPAHHLPVSLKGVKKNDFTMVWGYPGSTTRYLSSYGVNYNLNYFYPTLVDLLGKKLEIMKERMDKSDEIRLKYASSYASIANGWKNFIGQRKAIKRLKVADTKKTLEDQFTRWVSMNPEREKKYGNVLQELQEGYQSLEKVAVPFLYVNLGGMGLDIIDLASSSGELQTALEQKNKELIREMSEDFRQTVEAHYKESDLAVEKKTMAQLLEMFSIHVSKDQLPDI